MNYFERLAAAYVRGRLPELSQGELDALSPTQHEECVAAGLERGLRLHRFKRTMDLPRVKRVLGVLQGLAPSTLLDLGPGRGAFLWPLLDRFPHLKVTAVDLLDYRVDDILAVARGGVANLTAQVGDATRLPFPDGHFEVVTMLEVLEHVPDPRAALAEVCRVCSRHLVLSVPSQPDDNPEHIHLFRGGQLREWLLALGMRNVKLDGVLNHLLLVASR